MSGLTTKYGNKVLNRADLTPDLLDRKIVIQVYPRLKNGNRDLMNMRKYVSTLYSYSTKYDKRGREIHNIHLAFMNDLVIDTKKSFFQIYTIDPDY